MPDVVPLTELQQILAGLIDNGGKAVTLHAGSRSNPGEQVRIEFNFPSYSEGSAHYHIIAVKNTLIQLGLLDSHYQMSQHGYSSSFIVLNPDPKNPILTDPNFKNKFLKIYQEQKQKAELELLESTLRYAIHDGIEAVTIHPGSAANPGMQLRVEYNFPPHSTNGTFNREHYLAVRKTLIALGVVAPNQQDPEHLLPDGKRSPFMVIKPSANNIILNNPEFSKNFRKMYQEQYYANNATLSKINNLLNEVNTAFKYAQDPNKLNTQRLAKEKSLNESILKIINLANEGDAANHLQPLKEWVSKNQPLLDSWLVSDYVSHEVKQQIQKLVKLKEYYQRGYVANNPLIKTVMEKMIQSEKQERETKSFPGGNNLGLEVDILLKKLESFDRLSEMMPSEVAKSVQELLDEKNVPKEIKKFISNIRKDAEYNAYLAPSALAKAEIEALVTDIKKNIAYLNDGKQHRIDYVERTKELLNDNIKTLIAVVEKETPNWFSENKALLSQWLQTKEVSKETKAVLEKAIATKAEIKIVATAPTNKSEVTNVKAVPPVPPPRANVKAVPPVPPPRTDIKVGSPPVPPLRMNVNAGSSSVSPSTNIPTSGRKLPTPPGTKVAKAPELPPRQFAQNIPPTRRAESPPRKNFLPAQEARNTQFKAELESKLKIKAQSPEIKAAEKRGPKSSGPA